MPMRNATGAGLVSLAAVALAALGCSSEPEGVGASASLPLPVTSAPAVRGLDAVDSDPATVKLARGVLSCPPSESVDCPARSAWLEHRKANEEKLDATLVNLVEDEREAVRSLGAIALVEAGRPYRIDPALAQRVLAAAGKESQDGVARTLGAAAGLIDGSGTGQSAALRALLKEHPLPAMRRAALGTFLHANGGEDDLAFVALIARSGARSDDRAAAVQALGGALSRETSARACPHLLALGAGPEIPIAEDAILSATRSCLAEAPAIVKLIGERALAGTTNLSTTVVALREIAARPERPAELATQVKQAAMQLVKNPRNGEAARASALDMLSVEPATRDELLGFLEQDARAGTAQTRGVVDALRLLLEQVDLTAGQKKSALATLRAIVENERTDEAPRRNAFQLVLEHEPGDKAFAKKHAGLQQARRPPHEDEDGH